ncbi:protein DETOXIFICATION 42-like isoform X2 [Triticum dicoccoides]|uniref:protein DETOXIFICATION 42-like isoform X2 n=1 Tax=Triticum dicoccoides TaxID=85692 RepID=UPI00188E758E|nr:protein DETOXIFICATION 42-like isoform X2 [Triticum dicoccoides]
MGEGTAPPLEENRKRRWRGGDQRRRRIDVGRGGGAEETSGDGASTCIDVRDKEASQSAGWCQRCVAWEPPWSRCSSPPQSVSRHHQEATGGLRRRLPPPASAILASAFARKDHSKAKATAYRVLQLGLILGLLLGLLLGVGLRTGSRLFTEAQGVLNHIYVTTPFVALTQSINALGFVFDGVNYGASDFAYASYSLILVAVVSIACIVTLASYSGFVGIWIALSIYMCIRMFAGLWRIGTPSRTWAFLRS